MPLTITVDSEPKLSFILVNFFNTLIQFCDKQSSCTYELMIDCGVTLKPLLAMMTISGTNHSTTKSLKG